MPVAEGYVYADTPHPSTHDTPRYGCHNRGPLRECAQVQDGWTEDGRRRMVTIPTIPSTAHCGHDPVSRAADPKCAGCARQA